MHVLVVEDEPRMASVIRRALTREGLLADLAGDGEQALEMACVIDYDAIVLDVMLPGRSGFEVCRLLRERAGVDAGADAHGARGGRGPCGWARQRS